jgi:hypothetical protein
VTDLLEGSRLHVRIRNALQRTPVSIRAQWDVVDLNMGRDAKGALVSAGSRTQVDAFKVQRDDHYTTETLWAHPTGQCAARPRTLHTCMFLRIVVLPARLVLARDESESRNSIARPTSHGGTAREEGGGLGAI